MSIFPMAEQVDHTRPEIGLATLTTHGPSDEEFKRATAALEAETTALLTQCQILEQQKAVLAKIPHKSRSAMSNTASYQQAITRQHAHAGVEIEQVSSSLQDQLSLTLQRSTNMLNSFPDTISRTLGKDDRILDGLQKLVPRLEAADNLQDRLRQIDLLCKNFVNLEQQAVGIHVDTIYRKALTKGDGSRASPSTSNPQRDIQALKLELEELHNEVSGLVKLIADHYFRTYIEQALETSHKELVDEASKWSEYTACVLLYLTARLEALEELVKHAHTHKAALTVLQGDVQSALKQRPRIEAVRPQFSATISVQAGLKPLRLVQSSLSRSQDHIAPMLKLLDVDARTMTSETAESILADTLRSRLVASNEKQSTSSEALAERVNLSLGTGKEHTTHLLESLQAAIGPHGIRVRDQALQKQLDVLEMKTATVAQAMQALDVEQLADSLRKRTLDRQS